MISVADTPNLSEAIYAAAKKVRTKKKETRISSQMVIVRIPPLQDLKGIMKKKT